MLAGFVAPGLPAFAQPQSRKQARCITTLVKQSAKLVKIQGKEIESCMSDLVQNGGNDYACLAADPKGRIAKVSQKLVKTEARHCGEIPDFGFVGSAGMIAAATGRRVALARSLTSLQYLADRSPCGRMYLKQVAKCDFSET